MTDSATPAVTTPTLPSDKAGQEITAGYYKIDRFFSSTAEMMQSEANAYWYGL